MLSESLTGPNLHHAYLVEGGGDSVFDDLARVLEDQWSFPVRGNPDFFERSCTTFTVDDARDVRRQIATFPVAHPRRMCVIRASFMTDAAQNALLKTLEEAVHAIFFVIMPEARGLLPTLSSRMRRIPLARTERAAGLPDPADFLAAGYDKRIRQLATITKEKNKDAALLFTGELAHALVHDTAYRNKAGRRGVEAVQTARTYLAGPTPSVKMLLEYLSLMVPVITKGR